MPQLVFDTAGRLGLSVRLVSEPDGLTREVWFAASVDEGDTWLEPVPLAYTGPLQSYLSPATWIHSDPAALARELTWSATRPSDADGATTTQLGRAQRNDHLRWGGDYGDIEASSEGFVVTWIDHHNGYPQIWARVVGTVTE